MELKSTPMLLLATALLVVAAGSLAGVGTQAVFTDTATSTGNTFSSGTVSLVLTDADQTDLKPVAASVGGSGLAPGSLVVGFIEVENNGSLALRYSMAITKTSPVTPPANDALAAALTAGIDSRTAGTVCNPTQTGQTTVVAAGAPLSNLAFGDPSPTVATGDRPLAVAAAERLCFYVTLPIGTSDTAQGGTATYTFTFSAEQTANNP